MPRCKFKNQGVTATGIDINESISSKKDTSPHSGSELQNELRNVIELMGPNTPHLTVSSTSSEVDNDESYYTSTSIYSRVLQVKHVSKPEETERPLHHLHQSCDTPRDISQISALPSDSVRDEVNQFENRNVEKSKKVTDTLQTLPLMKPRHQHRPHFARCPCREYVKNYQERISNEGMVYKSDEYTIVHKEEKHNKRGTIEKVIGLLTSFKSRRPNRESSGDLYKINIKQPSNSNENCAPKRLVFDLVNDIPRPATNTVATNTVNEKLLQPCVNVHQAAPVMSAYHAQLPPRYSQENYQSKYTQQKHQLPNTMQNNLKGKENAARVDVYYFDHGNSSYFRTTDCAPPMITEIIAEKTEAYTTKFWAEFFGTIHIGFAFLTSFILQFLRFILTSLVRPLTIGLTQLASDYFFKPCLAVLFNAVIQPPLIFLYNIATSLRDLFDPIAEAVGYFLREIANVFRAFRFVNITKTERKSPIIPMRRKKLRAKRISR